MYCQKCRTPLKLDSSLDDLNPAAYDLLVATASQPPHRKRQPPRPANAPDADRRALYNQVAKDAGPPAFKRYGGNPVRGDGLKRETSPMDSFVLLSESTIGSPNSIAAGLHGTMGGGGGSAGNSRTGGSNGAFTSMVPMAYGRLSECHGDGDEDDMGAAAAAQGMERITKLFEILSARSDVDHPVCVECTELLVAGLQKRLDDATHERDAYIAFLKQTEADAPTAEELAAQAAALARAQQDEAAAMAELLQLERDKAALDGEIRALEAEARKLDREEEQFWRERNAFATKLATFQNERDSINAKYDHDARLLERLQRSNVYNDTFCISHDGTFATINGLRLGRLSTRPVDWPEINAAWGHALLLLVTVADKLNFQFENYEPLPMGSTSRIVRYEPPPPSVSGGGGGGGGLGGGGLGGFGSGGGAASILSQRLALQQHPGVPKKYVLELYSSGDMPLGLTFMHRKFDNAMVAFLELVRQLGVFVHQQTSAEGQQPLSLPYRIEGDKIGDVSIKLGIAQDDGWTKACKLTLTCCKFLLAHASNVNSSGRS